MWAEDCRPWVVIVSPEMCVSEAKQICHQEEGRGERMLEI